MIRQDKDLKRYCSEPLEHIENYDKAMADTENMWDCHHRLEVQGEFRNSRELLIKCGVYWHVPASQLIFIRRDEHIRLHMKNRSEQSLKKMSNSHKGKHLSDEHKKKISMSKVGKPRSEETRKKLSKALRGKRNALGCHRSEETRRKMREAWVKRRDKYREMEESR